MMFAEGTWAFLVPAIPTAEALHVTATDVDSAASDVAGLDFQARANALVTREALVFVFSLGFWRNMP